LVDAPNAHLPVCLTGPTEFQLRHVAPPCLSQRLFRFNVIWFPFSLSVPPGPPRTLALNRL